LKILVFGNVKPRRLAQAFWRNLLHAHSGKRSASLPGDYTHQVLGNVCSYLLHKIRTFKPIKLLLQESPFTTAGLFILEGYLTEFCLNTQ
jgi:hypothetical protein